MRISERASTLSWAAIACVLSTSLVTAEPAKARYSQVRLQSPAPAGAVERALVGARRRLGRPGCQRIFTEFEDGKGRPLREALDRSGASGEEFLGKLLFYDGSTQRPCERRRVLAFTAPGSQVIFVCSTQFVQVGFKDPFLAEAALIHESLHSLGLLENPPTSSEITSRVMSRCRG